MPLDEFKGRADRLVEMVRSSKTIAGVDRVYVPGEPEFEKKRERTENGIPMSDPVYEEMGQLG